MQIGDLVRNKSTGELAIVTGVGEHEAKKWLTLLTFGNSKLGEDIVYHAEFFEIVSEGKSGEIYEG